ncbi:SNF2-related protein [Variovorax sp. LT1R16]|uniref:SNF2-related protein n=1 Tax=Variovorax sp. LT1R16 TaxID=3443728 RepID=UPI003F4736CB
MAAGFTQYQTQYFAWLLSRQIAGDAADKLASTLVDAQVDLNPHQVDAALFAFRSPLSKGVILADEVGLGKTIEAGLVIAQRWAERKRKILIIVPANLRKQWHQELQDKFSLNGAVLEAKSFRQLRKQGLKNPFELADRIVICSYQFAKAKADELRGVAWDLVVMDEAHRLRNVYKRGNVIGKTLKEALSHAPKVLLTATPLQNSLMELYGLVSLVDDKVFGDADSFREQFSGLGNPDTFARLRSRLDTVCIRTLRRQVQPFIPYTRRIPMVQDFTPMAAEQALHEDVADYLRRPVLNALPGAQRQLISLVLWKLLASSSFAIAGALGTMATRLEAVLVSKPLDESLTETLDEDYEALDETEEEWSEREEKPGSMAGSSVAEEIAELREFQRRAGTLHDNAKGDALLKALDLAFAKLESLGAAKKALIFTESRRTQDYLLGLLESSKWAGQTVLFNGTNNSAQATGLYQGWLARHEGTDRITGVRTADTRAALVEHFRDHANIMIATEAGAEGINLQFCSLVINYDLPWNPQRIEQRIGRCHRYGQKHDVVVVNFIDLSNAADRRVYDLLAEKFQLFEGVFGASDEVLGTIGSGVDFERRIAEIYESCREPKEIEDSFRQLQLDLAGEISTTMLKTRQLLLENFDEAVQEKLKLRETESKSSRTRFERLLLDLTRSELKGLASADEGGFDLHELPQVVEAADAESVPLGRYELPRGSGDAHLYRVGHPLAQALIASARARRLPRARLRFDYAAHGVHVATLRDLRGQHGWLAVSVLSVESLGAQEEHLLVTAINSQGKPLHDEDPEKLLRLPAQLLEAQLFDEPPASLDSQMLALQSARLGEINLRNLGYFDGEVQKLDAWADDLKIGLENEVKELDREIKDVRRTASVSGTLDEKLHWQKQQRALEDKRGQLRRRIFDRQDEIDVQRSRLIDDLESRLSSAARLQDVFVIAWELV